VWYRNDGPAGFAGIEISRKNGPHSIVASDVDGDGDLDLVTAAQKASTISWYENVGSSAFAERLIDTASTKAKSALPTDIDNDGDVNVVAASYGDDIVALYRNAGSESFTKQIIDRAADGAYYYGIMEQTHLPAI
jgi:hypothetical protein